MFLNEAVVFALESEKAPDKKLFVEIDRAIEQGEIVVNMPEPVIKCEEMTLEQMFICCVRVNKLPIDDKVVLNYISVVNKELGQECRRDQFKFRKLKGEYQARLEKEMADFDLTKTYFIKVNSTITVMILTIKVIHCPIRHVRAVLPNNVFLSTVSILCRLIRTRRSLSL